MLNYEYPPLGIILPQADKVMFDKDRGIQILRYSNIEVLKC